MTPSISIKKQFNTENNKVLTVVLTENKINQHIIYYVHSKNSSL